MLSNEVFLSSMPLQEHFMWLENKTLRAFSDIKFGGNEIGGHPPTYASSSSTVDGNFFGISVG